MGKTFYCSIFDFRLFRRAGNPPSMIDKAEEGV